MNSLERLDKHKSKICKDLSVKDKLRTGYKTQTQLDNALETFVKQEKPQLAKESSQKLFSYIYPDIRMKVRMGIKLSSGVDVDEDDFETVMGSDDFATVMGYETSEESEFSFTDNFSEFTVSPPASVVAVAPLVEQQTDQLIALFERGLINTEQLRAGINQIREAVELRDEEGQFRGVIPREEITAPLYPPRQPIGRPEPEPTDGGEGSTRMPV